MHRNNEFELKTIEEQEKETLLTHQRITLAVSYFESINLTAIYSMFIGHFLQKFLEELGKYIMFPIAAAGSLIQAALAWREVYLSRGKSSRTIVRAIVETIAAVIIAVAVIGSLVASAIFGVVTPILFTATTAGKTLYHLGSTAYYTVRANTTKDPSKIQKYSSLAKDNGIATAAGCLSLLAVAGVFLLGKVVMTAIGIATGLFGAGYALYLGVNSYNQSKKPPVVEPTRPLIPNENTIVREPSPAINISLSNSKSLSQSNSQSSSSTTPQDNIAQKNIEIKTSNGYARSIPDPSFTPTSVSVIQQLTKSLSTKSSKEDKCISNKNGENSISNNIIFSHGLSTPKSLSPQIKGFNYLNNPLQRIPKNIDIDHNPVGFSRSV